MKKVYGILEGEYCNREGCAGVITSRLCDSTTSFRDAVINALKTHKPLKVEYCPLCGWENLEK